MDKFNAIIAVLQMAKAYQEMMISAGYPTDVYDDEAIVAVEMLIESVEGENDET